jgi:hypothetical protein
VFGFISRGGYDWADRFPLVVSAAPELPQESFVLDGEVVVLRPDSVSDFDALSSRKHDKCAMLCACLAAKARISVRCRSPSAKPTSRNSSRTQSTESLPPSMSRAIAVTFCSRSRAIWASRGLSRSASIGLRRRPVQTLGQDQEPRAPNLQ